eukprot:scaffold768_cov166-Amphora_coffeaeformis.AAC.7
MGLNNTIAITASSSSPSRNPRRLAIEASRRKLPQSMIWFVSDVKFRLKTSPGESSTVPLENLIA